jgi:hypothetical protein
MEKPFGIVPVVEQNVADRERERRSGALGELLVEPGLAVWVRWVLP